MTGQVVVVGGGLAGLTAGLVAAQAGARVTVLEARSAPGGRARSEERSGVMVNQGAHALYVDGEASAVLDGLGIRTPGWIPATTGARAMVDGRLVDLPVGPVSLLRTSLLDWRAKVIAARLLASVPRLDPAAFAGTSVNDWLDDSVADPTARSVMEALLRLVTYSADPTHLDAGAAVLQLQRSLHGSVRYLHGGWQGLVDQLRAALVAEGGSVRSDAKVTAVVARPGGGVAVELAGTTPRPTDPLSADPLGAGPVGTDPLHPDPVHPGEDHPDQGHPDQGHPHEVHPHAVHPHEVHPHEVHPHAVHPHAVHADAVVLAAGGPGRVADLLGPAGSPLRAVADRAVTTTVTALDIVLDGPWAPAPRLALGIDEATYLSVHTPPEPRRSRPSTHPLRPNGDDSPGADADGGAGGGIAETRTLVSLLAYHRPGRAADPDETRARLEAMLELVRPGWRSTVVDERFHRHAVVAHDTPGATGGGLAGRTPLDAVGHLGILVAGDWVGPHGLLADASVASGASAGRAAAHVAGARRAPAPARVPT